MRIAALYDLHGNLPALEAVLDAVGREGVDRVVVGGDVVPGPMPGECLAALGSLDLPVRFIHGNGERDVVAVSRGEVPARVPAPFHGVLEWVAKALGPEGLAEIEAWPATLRWEVPGLGGVLFCHATPRDDNEIFTRLTPEAVLRPVFEAAGAGVVLCGHTHMPFDRQVGTVRVVNAGSVGMPFGEPDASWALVDGSGVELRRTAYDLAAANARIQATGYPMELDLENPPAEAAMLQAFEAAALR